MRILIFGGTGFLAGRIYDFFKKKNYKVFIFSRSKLALKNSIKFNWNKSKLKNYLKKNDIIIHAAGPNYDSCENEFNKAKKFYQKSCKQIIDIGIKKKIKKIFFLSSTLIYKPSNSKIDERTGSLSKLKYARANIIGEKIILNYKKNNLDRHVLRLPNINGYFYKNFNNQNKLILHDFCNQLNKNRSLKLKSNGLTYKNFLSVTDLCLTLNFIIKKNIKINLLNVIGKNLTVKNFVKIFSERYKKITKKNIQIIFGGKYDRKSYKNLQSIHKLSIKISYQKNLNREIDLAIKQSLKKKI